MKYIFIFLFSLVSVFSFGQGTFPLPYNASNKLPITQYMGSDSTLTGVRGLTWSKFGLVNGTFEDTTAANLTRIKYYPATQIYTTDDSSLWVRNNTATRWILSLNENSDIITTIYNSTITSITNLNDSTVIICYGDGTCDTISTVGSSVTNINNYYFLNDSLIIICDTVTYSCDTSTIDPCSTAVVCDTINVGQQFLNIYQNGLNQLTKGIVEFGSIDNMPQTYLRHETNLNTWYYPFTIKGRPIWTPVTAFEHEQIWGISGPVTSWKSAGSGIDSAADYQNKVRLYLNYTGRSYGAGSVPAIDRGYMEDKIGYYIGTNLHDAGSYGQQVDDNNSKIGGIFFHTLDTNYTDVITFYGMRPNLTGIYGNLNVAGDNMSPARILTLNYNLDAQLHNYPNTRNDGVASKALYTDASGNVLLGPISTSSSINILNDSTIQICTSDGACDTITVSGGGVQTVFVVNDSTLLVCNTALTVCDTVNIPQTSFDRGFFDPDQASFGETTHFSKNEDFNLMGVDSLTLEAEAYFFNEGGVPYSEGTTLRILALDTTTGRMYRTSAITGISGDNGITENVANNIQWGGTLIQNTTITQTGFFTTFTSSQSNTGLYAVTIQNSTGGGALGATNTGLGNAVAGGSTTGVGVAGSATSGVGMTSTATSGLAFRARTSVAATNTETSIGEWIKGSDGTAAAGLGGQWNLKLEDNASNDNNAARVSWVWTDATDGSEDADMYFSAVVAGTITERLRISGDGRIIITARNETAQGADVASAAGAIAVGFDGNYFELTGTASITLISNVGWQNGSEITFVFTSTATLTDGTANSGTDIGMELAGNANFTGSADDMLTLVLTEVGGTQRWREKSRSVN